MEHNKNHRFENMAIGLNLVFAYCRVLYRGLNYISEEKNSACLIINKK